MKIIIKDTDPKLREQILRGKLSRDRKATTALVFCYINNPASVTEITRAIEKNTIENMDRNAVYFALKKLQNWGLVEVVTTEDIVRDGKTNTKEGREIMRKWREFTGNVPEHFQTRFNKMTFWKIIDNDNLIRFAAEKLGYEVE